MASLTTAAPQGSHPCKEVAVEERAPAISDVPLHTSMAAADWVICQTGCISHDQYWRVQDHCRRTGKQCVLVAQPDATKVVRVHRPASAAPADEGEPSATIPS